MRGRGLLGPAILLGGCLSEPAAVDPSVPPVIDAAGVRPGPHNVLSAVVSVRVRHADSVAVRFRLDESTTADDNETPVVPAAEGSVMVPVLGLLPTSRYALHVVAFGEGGTIVGGKLDFTTDALPTDLPIYSAGGPDPSPGYVVFAAGQYGLVIDNTGRVVWYRRFTNGPGLNFMAQPTGRYLLRPPTPEPTDLEPWLELDPLGDVTRTFGCAQDLQPRLHDLITESGGSYWIMCDEPRTMDLTTFGGVADARVIGTVVQHVGADGALLFRWSPFDHFAITDLEPGDRAGPSVNWTHGNALDFDADGNLIVSFRSLGEITKINVTNGSVIWRMGGRANQFTFLDTPVPAFSRQHSVRSRAPDALLILDNVGDPAESRAERYALDEAGRTARLVHSYGSSPRVVTQIGGSVQDLPGGRTLVSFGTVGRVEEYDAAGRVIWRIEGNAGYVFRAQRIRSLYAPGVGTAR
jgi:hypothetical protein